MATFTNQATLSYNGNTVNSNTVTGNIVEVLAVTKTALNKTYSQNEDVTYVVSLTNSGTLPLNEVTVTDNLGEYDDAGTSRVPLDYIADSAVYYQNGVLQNTLVVTEAPTLTFSGITIPAGGNAIIIYEARPNEFAPLDVQGSITNEVSATAIGITTPATDTAIITTVDEPNLSITKLLTPVNVTENGEITYTFTIQNTGNSPADTTDKVQILDTFDPILSGINVAVNGTTIPATNYSYNQTTGEFSTNPGVITVPAATFEPDPTTGIITTTPGVTTVTVTGRI